MRLNQTIHWDEEGDDRSSIGRREVVRPCGLPRVSNASGVHGRVYVWCGILGEGQVECGAVWFGMILYGIGQFDIEWYGEE